MLNEFAKKSCNVCVGGIPAFDMDQIRQHLSKLPDWKLLNGLSQYLERKFLFKTYNGAFFFIKEVSKLAENQGHHPDVVFGWGYATILFTTHASHGLTENDFIMAAKVSALVEDAWHQYPEDGATRLLKILSC